MTENNYSYVIEYGNTKFYKNRKFMTSSEVLNELEVKDVIINQFSEENKELQERNKRQCKQLDDLCRLIEEKDWRALSDIMDDFKRNDEQLQKEWSEYND